MPFRMAGKSRLPYAMDKKALLPKHRPIITEVKKVRMVYEEPTAASAVSPIYLPTTHVSTRLYSCCMTLPSMSGRANSHKLVVIFPVVRSRSRLMTCTPFFEKIILFKYNI